MEKSENIAGKIVPCKRFRKKKSRFKKLKLVLNKCKMWLGLDAVYIYLDSKLLLPVI